MKVKDIIKKAHLYPGQAVTVNNVTTAETYKTKNRYSFEHEKVGSAAILNLKVNSFDVSADGLTIWAE